MDPKTELTVEMRRARGWILAVGIIMFVVDTFMIQVLQADQIEPVWKTRILLIDFGILGYFVTLFFVAKVHPKAACVLALLGYWGLQIGAAVWVGDFASLVTKGILLKILFTGALVRGYKSASRAVYLKDQLAKVFE
jgi:hypothetical protein